MVHKIDGFLRSCFSIFLLFLCLGLSKQKILRNYIVRLNVHNDGGNIFGAESYGSILAVSCIYYHGVVPAGQ